MSKTVLIKRNNIDKFSKIQKKGTTQCHANDKKMRNLIFKFGDTYDFKNYNILSNNLVNNFKIQCNITIVYKLREFKGMSQNNIYVLRPEKKLMLCNIIT